MSSSAAANPESMPGDNHLSFGTIFTDHMLRAEYEEGRGWLNYRIEPYGPLSFDPAAAVLHYGQSVFDGLKAFRSDDGRVRLFRPEKHIERLSASARRLCMPALDSAALSWLVEFVRTEQDSVPSTPGTSLYLRPTIVATEAFLGVRPARSYGFFVIASPVGPYYSGNTPLKIRIEDKYVRAAPGGLGAAKTGANYVASLLAAQEAQAAGFDQVLWLDGLERRYLEEVGTMNIMVRMVRIGDEVVTPPLGDTILAGVIRDSALTLLREWGVPVSERPIAVNEIIAGARNGTLQEAWGTGTAAGISPISELGYKDQRYFINEGRPGDLSARLAATLADIQYARAVDTRGWTVLV
jgi:branched-chain amino acid aminotransferase